MAMTHEGGTVAGESPDRSEQRKSSGATTGSERDPRLAVLREGSPASSEPSEPSASAAEPPLDERTTVFRALPPRGAAEAAEAENAVSEDASTEADVPHEAAAQGGADAAEEAVAEADAAAEAPARRSEADDEDEAVAESGTGADDAAADADEASARTPSGQGDASHSTQDGAGSADAEDGDRETAAASRTGAVPADGAAAASGGPRASGPSASPAEATDAVDDDSDSDADDANNSDADDADDADAPEASEPPPSERTAVFRTLPARGASDAAQAAPEAAEGDGDAEPSGKDARLRAAVAAWVGKTDDAESSASPAPSDAPAEKASAEAAVDDGSEADSSASANAGADAKANTKSHAKAGAEAGAANDDGPAERPPVDQPTTTFKALRRPAVDQPTTALKLPPLPKPATASEPATGSAKEPAVDAGRSSTFVPLRRDDAHAAAPQKPQAAAAPLPPASLTEAERTKQQPMPPLPPLDLLAELTNTPPPPETPVRTVVRRIKIWTPLVLLLLIVFAVAQMVRPLPDPELALTAEAEVAFDGGRPALPWPGEGQGQIAVSGLGVVGEFGEEKPVPIASVTKTMTAYIIMRDHPFKRGEDGASIPVDALAEKEGGYDRTNDESTLNTIKEGDTISQRDALSAVMIPSANNVARLLARWDAGSEKAFVKKMNDTAKELGMTNTTYTDPSGLDATTVSTAADQVKLGQALVKNKAMVDITRQQEWYDPSGKRHSNYNTLMPRNGAIGIKTGSTTKAGGNLLFAAYRDIGGTTQTIVGAVLGQHKPSILETVNRVSEEVLVATREALKAKTVVKKGDVVGHVDDGLGGYTPVVATKDMTVVGWSGLKVELGMTDGGKKLPHTAKAGTVVGSITAGSGAGTVSVPVALQKDLAEPGFGAKLTRIG
ncbi:D-alanyl-D-alanine carboxypeptidase (penicillin-binding protein 5/6) [Streptomyces sp. V4I23]|uniref:serine hydrolase n=1 Tax=Streptomyces sp. V4I23 TaxID=3042282 RepID=UPI00278752F2|nr:serine hydrolase [Streptomyces sp. V4I23]MDQ1010180.1 D-alanyl-D-alanine carboxypeptidase (penicillin-binding protein 5/6) [Streptomyces sp. V4I23]